MKLKKLCGVVALLGLLLTGSLSAPARSGPAHDFHISKCQIEYNHDEQALQMTLHIFIDDLEEALRKQGADKLFIGTEREVEDADPHLLKYLEKNFLLQVNEQKATYDYIGKEVSEDLQGLWIYLEITGVDTVKTISVTNSILLEIFDDQKNITSVSVPPSRQNYFILENGKSQESINY